MPSCPRTAPTTKPGLCTDFLPETGHSITQVLSEVPIRKNGPRLVIRGPSGAKLA